MSEEKKTNALPVEAQTQSKDVEVPAPESKPFVLLEVPKLTQAQVDAAKAFNVPLDKLFEVLERINVYASTVEQRFNQVEEGFKKVGVFLDKVAPLADLAEKYKAQQNVPVAQQQPQQPQGDPATLSTILKLLDGGGGNPVQDKVNKFVDVLLDNAIAKATTPSKFEQYFDEELAKAKAKTLAAAMTQ